MLIPLSLLAIALSVAIAEPIQKIEKGIQEFPSKLFSFLINPTFLISAVILCLTGLIFLIIFKYKSHKECKMQKMKGKEETKKLSRPKTNKTYFEESKDELDCYIKEEKFYEPVSIGTYERSVKIRVDENKRYFRKNKLNKDEVKYLLNDGYQIRKYKNLLNGKMEDFLLLPRFNESFTHLFLAHNISEFLEKNGIETELYITKKPDIVFRINGKRYAIEVETGSIFSKINRMEEKLKALKDYDEWFFVVTDRNKVKKYKKYGDAVDKRYVKSRLDKLVKLAKKVQK